MPLQVNEKKQTGISFLVEQLSKTPSMRNIESKKAKR
jgi:hypothetical protein